MRISVLPKLAFAALAIVLLHSGSAHAAIVISSTGSTYDQDFNAMPSGPNGTFSSVYPTGWTADPSTYRISDGNHFSGGSRDYGSIDATDRALGSISNGLRVYFGAEFANLTGESIVSLAIDYFGEQWRRAQNVALDTLYFEYSLDAISLTSGTWIAQPTLNFVSPNTVGDSSALDGNLAGNRTAVAGVISGLDIPDNTTFWIRWRDEDIAGGDHGMAVDDFNLTAFGAPVIPDPAVIPEPASAAVWGLMLLGTTFVGYRRRQKLRAEC